MSRGRRSSSESSNVVSLVVILVVVAGAATAYGWGSGHATQAQMVVDALPQKIKDFFPEDLRRKIVNEYSFYPDTVRRFDPEMLGQRAVEELDRMAIKPGDLHNDLNVAISFVMLNRAFAEKNPKHAAVWLGSLIHTTGDDSAHLPLLAYLAEMRRFQYHVRMGVGCSDLSQTAETDAGRATLKRLMAGYVPRAIAGTPDEALRKLVLLAYREMDYGAQKQSRIAATFNADGPKAAREDGLLAMAELGAEGAKNMVDATLTAWEFAERKMPVELNRQQIAEARKEVQAYLKTKPLEHDTIYAGTLENRPSGAFVGVLVEPSTFMGESRFGYCGGVVQGQIMRTCRDAGVSYRALDVRRIGEEGLPGVDAMPVLVVTSGSFNSPDAPLRKYVAAGGRLLWIGGWDKGLLGKLSAAIKPANPRLLPVSSKYEDPNCEVVARTAVLFLGDIEKRLGGVRASS